MLTRWQMRRVFYFCTFFMRRNIAFRLYFCQFVHCRFVLGICIFLEDQFPIFSICFNDNPIFTICLNCSLLWLMIWSKLQFIPDRIFQFELDLQSKFGFGKEHLYHIVMIHVWSVDLDCIFSIRV